MADDVLVVEDNDINRALLEYVIKSTGIAVRGVDNATGALAEVARSPPRLILTDVNLPGLSGLELTRRLKADPATAAIVIVIVTGYARDAEAAAARAAGADDYLMKPVPNETLRQLARTHAGPRPI